MSEFPPMFASQSGHTTHFDDCGCKTAALETKLGAAARAIDNLESKLEERSREAASTAAERDAAREAVTVNYQRWEEARDRAEKAEQERDALRLRVAECEAALRLALPLVSGWTGLPKDYMKEMREGRAAVESALSGDTTALRAMLVEAAKRGADNAYEDASSYACETEAGRLLWADGIADRILGASKEGK